MICLRCTKKVNPKSACYGLHQNCFIEWFDLDAPLDFTDLVRRQEGINEENQQDKWSAYVSSFYQGKFKKYSAKLANTSYILKMQENEYPDLPAMEFLCNQLAEYLGLLVPAFAFILFENNLPTFVCKNFMQYHQSSNLIHIYRFLIDPKEYNCEKLYQTILEHTKRLRDAHRFIELTLFDGLLGNHDRHGRNIALIQSPNGYILSPFYDNPCYLGLEDEILLSAQHEPRGKIATSNTQEPTLKDYVFEWKKMGFEKNILDFYHKIDLESILSMIDNSFISIKRKEALKKLVNKRYTEFSNVITSQ